MCLRDVCSASTGQKRALYPLELESSAVVSLPMWFAENRVLCKSTEHS